MDVPPKLRIMCSYGGQIVPRPRTKSLCYAGGDTRIVSLRPNSITDLSSLISHLTSTLSVPSPFTLKYQLPNHDLDSLISLLTDEDLTILLEELQRLDSTSGSRSRSSSSSRIRLFVFAAEDQKKIASSSSVMQHPKTEAWFHDALRGAKIMQKGRNSEKLGFEGEAVGGDDLVGNGNGIGCSTSVAETMMLETTSSFGSTSSSASLTNLAPVKSNVDDTGIGLQESIVKLNPSDAISSEYGVSTVASCTQSDAFKGPTNPIFVTSVDSTKISPNTSELEIREPPLMQQQKVQYIQVESPYMSQNLQGLVPMSSFYPYYHTQLPQRPMMQFQYQPNQPQPVYLYPVAPPTYSLPGYPGYAENPTLISGQSPFHTNTSLVASKVVHTEPAQIDALPNNTSQVYNTAHSAVPLVSAPMFHVPYTENPKQVSGLCEKPHQTQSVVVSFREASKDSNELFDDPARVQIYKSQPPPPACLPQYHQTMTKATEMLLSEALDQLHTDSLKQQVKTPQPQ